MSDEGQTVRLNLFPITPQRFHFKVWRKIYQGERKEGLYADLYCNSLPEADNQEERNRYWVSFSPLTGFSEFICQQDSNHRLTIHFLYNALLRRAEKSIDAINLVKPKSKYR
jgi:hypothetical protein